VTHHFNGLMNKDAKNNRDSKGLTFILGTASETEHRTKNMATKFILICQRLQ